MPNTLVKMDAGVLGARDPYDHGMTFIEDIIESIEDRLRELHEEIGALNAARDALNGHGSRAATRRQRRAAASKTRTGPSKDAGGAGPLHGAVEPVGPASTAALELLLSDTGGLATSELAERAHADRDQVLTALRELEAAGRVHRTGQRRSTRWHAITDEERRIRERAPKRAARSRSAGTTTGRGG